VSTLDEIRATIAQAVEAVGPAVVGIGRGWHPGSGFVVSPGSVVTSAHNVRGDETTVVFDDGRRAAAKLAGVDPELDVAVLAVETGDAEPVRPAPEETAIEIGTPVVALANPGGRGLRATLGFASATERSFRGPRGRRIRGCIEHSAPLPRGSAGGPLVDVAGRLVGLNAVRLGGGLILAVPAGAAFERRTEALARGEAAPRVRLGVAVAPPYVARRLRRAVGLPEADGVLVRAVEEQSPAAAAGIETGDLIVSAGGRPIDAVDALYESLDAIEPGASLELRLLRGTEEREITVSFDREREEATK
jgi:serine protease Do